MTNGEMLKVAAAARALYTALGTRAGDFGPEHAIQLVAGAMGHLISDVRLEGLKQTAYERAFPPVQAPTGINPVPRDDIPGQAAFPPGHRWAGMPIDPTGV